MSLVKYFATMTGAFGPIRKVVVDRETPKCIWVDGRRQGKESGFGRYFDSFEEAKNYLLDKADQDLARARRLLQRAQAHHGNIKGLKEPCE